MANTKQLQDILTAVDEQIRAEAAMQLGLSAARSTQVHNQPTITFPAAAAGLKARIIQRSLPDLAGWSASALYEPADAVGGDIYRLHTTSDGRLFVLFADVMGHGYGPALTACRIAGMFDAAIGLVPSIAPVIPLINQKLIDHAIDGIEMVTAFFAEVDLAESKVRWLAAGQAPILVALDGGRSLASHPASALPLGVDSTAEYAEWGDIAFRTGDWMLLASDGVFEAKRTAGDRYGIERACEQLASAAPHDSAASITQCLSMGLRLFLDDTRPDDDVSMLGLLRGG